MSDLGISGSNNCIIQEVISDSLKNRTCDPRLLEQLERDPDFAILASNETPKRKTLNISEKIELIKFIDSCPPMKKKDIAAMYGIPLNTVSTIYSNREKLLQRSGCDFSNLSQMRIRASSFPEVEEALISWYTRTYAATNERPSGNLLRLQALDIAKKLGIENFLASNGWIERFKTRHNLKMYKYKTKKNRGVINNSESSNNVNKSNTLLNGVINNSDSSFHFNASDVSINGVMNKSSYDLNRSDVSADGVINNNESSYDLNRSDASRNGNSSDPESYNFDSNVWEHVSNPVMELTELKQEPCNSPRRFESVPNSVVMPETSSASIHIVPDQNPHETVTDIHIKQSQSSRDSIVRPSFSGCKRRRSEVTFEEMEEAYGVINNYFRSRKKSRFPEKTLDAVKELESFISAEKDKKTQSKITDYFSYN